MHRDAVVGVSWKLKEGLCRGAVDVDVGWLQVVHQRGNRVVLAECYSVVAPHAASRDGIGQVSPKLVISLPKNIRKGFGKYKDEIIVTMSPKTQSFL